jgi:cysteine desulfurase
MRIYLDNAATTAIDQEVVQEMTEVLSMHFGNPSSSHSFGRDAKALIETSRRRIAGWMNCESSELIFTSGGTESDNMAIYIAVFHLGIKRIVTSRIEHHAVSHTVEAMEREFGVEIEFVDVDEKGNVSMDHLGELLSRDKPTLVSLMHANNELGTLLSLERVSSICRTHNALFHSDTVQGVGHYRYDLKTLGIDFLTCAAHKFHGPKGTGFLYINKRLKVGPFIRGGAQERGQRGGTENVAGICGLAKAFDLAYTSLEAHKKLIQEVKTYFIDQLNSSFADISYLGEIHPDQSLYTILNVSFPPYEGSGMLLFRLDLKGIAASGGSACSSGSTSSSHVLTGIKADVNRPNVRFSFSKFTTKSDIDAVIEVLKDIIPKH